MPAQSAKMAIAPWSERDGAHARNHAAVVAAKVARFGESATAGSQHARASWSPSSPSASSRRVISSGRNSLWLWMRAAGATASRAYDAQRTWRRGASLTQRARAGDALSRTRLRLRGCARVAVADALDCARMTALDGCTLPSATHHTSTDPREARNLDRSRTAALRRNTGVTLVAPTRPTLGRRPAVRRCNTNRKLGAG